MNLILPTIGTRGLAQPYIALALGLRQAADLDATRLIVEFFFPIRNSP